MVKLEIRLYVSQSLVKALGTQRIIPAPGTTNVGNGGLTYNFPASRSPAIVQLALEPLGLGFYDLTVGVLGASSIQAKVPKSLSSLDDSSPLG
jgi:hypothetical protein